MASASDGGARRPDKIRLAVLFGGQSAEHDVSLRSARTIIDALDPDRYEVVPIGVTRDGRWLTGGDPLRQLAAESPLLALGAGEGEPDSEPPADAVASAPGALPGGLAGEIDVVVPVLHGPMGEDGTVQGLLELAGVPYVGSGVLGSAVAMDKAITKTILAQAGLPQVPWRLVNRKDWERAPAEIAEAIGTMLGYPCFVKPANMGSSVGVTKVHDGSELAAAMTVASRYDRRLLVEAGLDVREFEVSVLGNDDPIASVAGEVIAGNEFYDYNAKYVDESSQLIIPAELEGQTLVSLQEMAIASFLALDLAGLARVDFFIERGTDHIYVNEINTIPGFTSISMYPMLWEASGIPLSELVNRLVELAVERHAERRRGPA